MFSRLPSVLEFPLSLFLLVGALVVAGATAAVGEWILLPLAFFSGGALGGVVFLLIRMLWSGVEGAARWLFIRKK